MKTNKLEVLAIFQMLDYVMKLGGHCPVGSVPMTLALIPHVLFMCHLFSESSRCWCTLLVLENLGWVSDWLTQELNDLIFNDTALSPPVSDTSDQIPWFPFGNVSFTNSSLPFPLLPPGHSELQYLPAQITPVSTDLFLVSVFLLLVSACTTQPYQFSENFNLVISFFAQNHFLLSFFCSHHPSYLKWLPVYPCKLTYISRPHSDDTASGRPSLISPLNSNLTCLYHIFAIHVCCWTSGINFLVSDNVSSQA